MSKDKANEDEARIVRKFHQLYYDQWKRTWHNTYWLGVPVQKNPLDLWIYQELLHSLKPDLIVECGTASGGSALFFASLCDLIGCGRILTIDVASHCERPNHPGVLSERPKHPRIQYVTASSTAPSTVETVKTAARGAARVLVVLDSDHSYQHVLDEMRIYANVVTSGSYLVVEDGNINGHPVLPGFGPGPAESIKQFLSERGDFIVDRSCEKFFMTFNPRGYLKKN